MAYGITVLVLLALAKAFHEELGLKLGEMLVYVILLFAFFMLLIMR